MLEVHLLGTFEISLDGQPLELPSRPAQSLLAYLAQHPGVPHRRERLAGLLWPESEESNARRYLSQALWRLRKALGETYFQADKLTLTFTPQPDDRIDAALLEQTADSTEALMETLALYQGRLLPGFYEDWAWEQAEHFQARFERLAQTLLDRLIAEQRWQEAFEWGEHWIRLGETPEPAYRALMQAQAGLGDQAGVAAVYRRCVTALARDLGVEPSPETTALYERIRSGELKVKAVPPPVEIPPTLPAFLEEEQPPHVSQPVFVAREGVLRRLEDALAQALEGHGQVAFVVGEAGQGKTSLLFEFLRRTNMTHPDVLTALGSCSAYTGSADPYLPFREVMRTLTGDVEGAWRVGQVPTDKARLLWRSLPKTIEALVDRGQNLIGTLVPGPNLLARGQAAGLESSLTARLEKLVAHSAAMEGMPQDFLFEQTRNVLHRLAEAHPLILMLDDLHWADESSTALLFHLGRRLRDSRILLLGAYRPEDVAHGQHAQPHPLQGAVRELQRLHGEIEVNLDQDSRANHQRFVEAYLDTEPNRLAADFRQAFAHHTGGNPLFTVETLREMQVRGDIRQDDDGNWVAAPELSWQVLAARVEGVIANRIARLSPEAGELLTAASVEGEVFTAEVLAQVLDKDARFLVRQLSGPLAHHHHLVREQGMVRLNGGTPQRLSQFRFRHHLFQSYLYSRLGEAERAYLHEDVGKALESLYAGRTAEVAVQLARHYRQAGQVEKEIHYLRQAGEVAAREYANDEAVDYFTRALARTPNDDLEGRYELLLAREKVLDLQGNREAQASDLVTLKELAKELGQVEKQAEVALRQANYAEATSNFSAALEAAQRAVSMAQTTVDPEHEARGHLAWGRALWEHLDYDASRDHLQVALRQGKAAGQPKIIGISLRSLGVVAWYQGNNPGARDYFEQAMVIAREIGDRQNEAIALNNIGNVAWEQGDYSGARGYHEQSLVINQEIGNRSGERQALSSLGVSAEFLGNYPEAQSYHERSLEIAREIGDRLGEIQELNNLGAAVQSQGNYPEAQGCHERALVIARDIGDRLGEGISLNQLGVVTKSQGNYPRAQGCSEQALTIFREIGNRRGEGIALGILGAVIRNQEGYPRARDYLEQSLAIFREIGFPGGEGLALSDLGDALAGLGQLVEATLAYKEAIMLHQKLGEKNVERESRAGLARVALAQDSLDKALSYIADILDYLDRGNSLNGTREPLRIYLTCYQVLEANNHPRATEILETAHSLLQERAAKISDEEMRRLFLENVPWHREIVELWERISPESSSSHP